MCAGNHGRTYDKVMSQHVFLKNDYHGTVVEYKHSARATGKQRVSVVSIRGKRCWCGSTYVGVYYVPTTCDATSKYTTTN
jgi:hypothetical protein